MRTRGPLPLKTKMDYYNWTAKTRQSERVVVPLWPLFEDVSILLLVYSKLLGQNIFLSMTPIDNRVSLLSSPLHNEFLTFDYYYYYYVYKY